MVKASEEDDLLMAKKDPVRATTSKSAAVAIRIGFFFFLFFFDDDSPSGAFDSLTSVGDIADSEALDSAEIPQEGQKLEPMLSAPQDLQNALMISSW
jgi:hypothetical protein